VINTSPTPVGLFRRVERHDLICLLKGLDVTLKLLGYTTVCPSSEHLNKLLISELKFLVRQQLVLVRSPEITCEEARCVTLEVGLAPHESVFT
jgi:hypothetical protein